MHCEYYEHRRGEFIIEKCVKVDAVIPASQERHACAHACTASASSSSWRRPIVSWFFRHLWTVTKLLFFLLQLLVILHFIVDHSDSPIVQTNEIGKLRHRPLRLPLPLPADPDPEPEPEPELELEPEPEDESEDRFRWTRRDSENRTVTYTMRSPLIWIGGMPRSGTTLMRVILDAHSDIRCAPETRIIPRLLNLRGSWNSAVETSKLKEAGLYEAQIDRAVGHFVMDILTQHGEAAKVLCNKDPFTLENATYLSRLFPNSKFILMIRDGRAVVTSIIRQRMNINGCSNGNYSGCLENWNRSIAKMLHECDALGDKCMRVYYELLVVDPHWWIAEIIRFLQLPFDATMLRYYEQIGITGGIPVSRLERSTDQVRKPIYRNALTDWILEFPKETFHEAAKRAPLLAQLGYDVLNYPPDYAVLKNKLK